VVPYFVAAAAERVEPGLRERPFAVVTGAAPATRIVEANTVARAVGVHPAMTESEARARCPELTTRLLAGEVQATACYALLDAALVVSPRVEDAGAGVVHVDVTGLERLIGDAAAVGRRLVRETRAVGFTATVGLAESRATARIAARLGRSVTVVAPGRERATLALAPLAVIEPDAATAATLARWGVHTLGELAALPRDGLAARLGAGGLRLHDLACGLDRAPFRVYAPPPFYQEAQGLEWEIDTLDTLAAALAPVLERLCARLTSSHLAADVLDIDLRLATGEHHQRRVAFAHPLIDAGAMLTLAHLDLEAHPPPAAVTGVAVTAQPVRTVAGQGGLWHPTTPAVRELATVLTRLAALVGPASVGSPRLVDSHRADPVTVAPFEIGGVSDSPPKPPMSRDVGGSDRAVLALRRLRPPRGIDVECIAESPATVRWNGVRYSVKGSAGPWRLSGDWWDVDGWVRDEWDVALADGTLCRLTHDLRTGAWFLDAVYD
jgi:protein ImuB